MLGDNTSRRAQVKGYCLDFTWTPLCVCVCIYIYIYKLDSVVRKIRLAPDLPEHKTLPKSGCYSKELGKVWLEMTMVVAYSEVMSCYVSGKTEKNQE